MSQHLLPSFHIPCIVSLNVCEFELTPGDADGQGGLACCSSWGHKETRLSD